MSNKLNSKKDTAAAVSISTRTLDTLVKQGRVPSIKIGSRRLFDIPEVIAALKSGNPKNANK